MGTITDYLAALPTDRADALRRVIDVARSAAPEAEEGTSYGMPALLVDGKPLLGVQSATKHLAVYPFSPAAVTAVSDQLPAGTWSKGTVRFDADRPLADDVVTALVQARLGEIRP